MKIALITDTHFGSRNDQMGVTNYFNKFYNDIFFPTIDKEGIKNVIHLGDLVDRRKYVNFQTLSEMNKNFVQPLVDRNIQTEIMIGNHDSYYKNTIAINAPRLLVKANNINIIDQPQEINYDGLDVLLLPWICDQNFDQTLDFIENSRSEIVMGHLQLVGFEMNRGSFCEDGLTPSMFNKFDQVYTGHFHQRSSQQNISYIGAPYEMIASDYKQMRGFTIFDTDTRTTRFIKNPYHLFTYYHYDDATMTEDELLNFDFTHLTSTITKVIIRAKEKPFLFEHVYKKIEEAEPLQLIVVEENMNFMAGNEVELNVDSTESLVDKYCDFIPKYEDRIKVKQLMSELFTKSLENL